MPQYRVYILGKQGDPVSAVGLDCADDEVAKERVKDLVSGREGELWRLVALFEPDNPLHEPKRYGTAARD
jgi:hypothetical protein